MLKIVGVALVTPTILELPPSVFLTKHNRLTISLIIKRL
jgi:hypothetical protein